MPSAAERMLQQQFVEAAVLASVRPHKEASRVWPATSELALLCFDHTQLQVTVM